MYDSSSFDVILQKVNQDNLIKRFKLANFKKKQALLE
jgi:hypothetical protein